MESLVDFFFKEFLNFRKNNSLREKIYITHKGPESDIEESKYISREVLAAFPSLTRCASAMHGNIKIYFSHHKKYILEFIVFYTKWLSHVFGKLRGRPMDRGIELIILLTSLKKEFPRDNSALTINNVNSGLTSYSLHGGNKRVYVFREEEVLKVLAHELIHAYEIDNVYFPEDCEQPLKVFFGKSNRLVVNESFTDTLACLVNVINFSIFWSLIKYGNACTSSLVKYYFTAFLERERTYILSKSRDLLNYEKYIISCDGILQRGTTRESTHTISYYVLKAVNFCHLEDFIKYISPNGYRLTHGEASAREYVNFLKHCVERPDYWQHLCRIPPSFVSQSLRMSDVDIILLVYAGKSKLLKTLLSQ